MTSEGPDEAPRPGPLLGVVATGFALLLILAFFVSSLLPVALAAGALLAALVLVLALRGP